MAFLRIIRPLRLLRLPEYTPSGKAMGSFSKGSFSTVANIAIIEKDPSGKDPIAIGRFAAHKNPKTIQNTLWGPPKRVFC